MKKHNFDPLSFIAGAILLAIAAGSLVTTDLDYQLSDWILPASVLVLGIGLLAASLRGLRARDNGQETTDDRRQTTEGGPESEEDDGPRTTDHGSEASEDTLVE